MGSHITITRISLDATRAAVWDKLAELGLIWPVVAEVQDAILGWVRNWKQYGEADKGVFDGGPGTGTLTGRLDLRLLTDMARHRDLSWAPYGAYNIIANYP